jgi:hypothetical protein
VQIYEFTWKYPNRSDRRCHQASFQRNLASKWADSWTPQTKHDLYVALALTVRDRLFQRTVPGIARYWGAVFSDGVATIPQDA